MKWIFYVIVFIYMFYRAVYGARNKESGSITIEPVKYDGDKKFLLPGVRKTISCLGANPNQKAEWFSPKGNAVKRVPANRVFVQENFVPQSMFRTRVTAQVLVFTGVTVEDTGVWECRAGGYKQNVSLCVIDPSQFVDTSTVVTVDSGRSITLSCQAKGDPEPRVLWYRDGEIISDDVSSSKYQVMTKYNSQGFEGLLTIMSLEAEDSGAYTCEAIQESPFVDDCIHEETFNISLQVNHAPTFKDGNYTVVYGTEGESLQLICSAAGFPMPAYRWFQDNDDVMSEFAQDTIQLVNDGAEAVLTLQPKSYSWNQKYRCRATNRYGQEDKSFLLVKTEKPTKPNDVQTHSESATNIQIELTWNHGISFPVISIDVQYLMIMSLRGRKPRESDWMRSKLAELKPDNVDDEGLNMTLKGLDGDTKYYIRLRIVNAAGKSQWSKVILASTLEEPELTEESDGLEELDEEAEEPEQVEIVQNTKLYGIFFAGGIILIAIAFMFVMRMV